MIFKFNDTIDIKNIVAKEIIFEGDNGIGFVEDNIVTIADSKHIYEYRKNVWFIGNIETLIMYPCGVGAVPILDIENLVIKNVDLFNSIIYVPPVEE